MDPEVRKKAEGFLKNVKQMPTLPDVYTKVKKAFEDPSLSIEYLSDAIRLDQALTVSLLRLANSPLYGYRQKISSISQAVMLIGLRELYSLVLSVSIVGLFPMKDKPGDPFPSKKYWEHSLGVAVTARILAQAINYPRPDELFVAGLIHDIGIMIEKMYLGDQFGQICRKAQEEDTFFIDTETKELGFNHAHVGQILTESWHFPELLVTTTACHHNPSIIEDKEIRLACSIIHVSQAIVRGMDLGWAGDPYIQPLDEEAIKLLHLVPWNDMSVLLGRIWKDYKASVEILVP